jgi:hypothetical protein
VIFGIARKLHHLFRQRGALVARRKIMKAIPGYRRCASFLRHASVDAPPGGLSVDAITGAGITIVTRMISEVAAGSVHAAIIEMVHIKKGRFWVLDRWNVPSDARE